MSEINAGIAVMTEDESNEEMTRTNTTQYELTEQLSRKMHITLEEARITLEAADWNMLTATHLLEQEAFRRKQALDEIAAAEALDEDHTTEKAEEETEMKENGLKKVGRAIMISIIIFR